ncbi:hypothetical protein CASFOL_002296 [Castilleja foliolosa]|uniref:Protein kinase domain-containing protein n=1 Tax=Castilleja foliolosa TaxID=1961234 RepID=A0ABD3EHK8_9LAMI
MENNDIQNTTTSLLVVLFAGMLVFFYLYMRNKLKRSPSDHVKMGSEDDVKITTASSNVNGGGTSETYSHGSIGPDNFRVKNILCRIGFGTVYKGEFHDETKFGVDYFKYKIPVLTQVRHTHLVALSDYFLNGNERILVHEYMPQGTLSRFLFDWKEEAGIIKPLEWAQRLIIASDVGIGVAHLHALPQMIVHTDLKPSNILLGDDMRAKVAYFGLDDGKNSVAATKLGHLAPEYAVLERVTTKIDVYSFGVILMQMITGRQALDQNLPDDDQQHLVRWFRRMLINKDTFRKAIDPTLDLNEETYASIGIMAELAGHCTAVEPYQRPDMRHVVNVLSSLANPDNVHGIDYGMTTLPKAVKRLQ